MTRPGSSPSRGRHAAPDDDARPDEDRPLGRHAVPDPPRRRHAAAEPNGYHAPHRRRHAAPDDQPYAEPYEPYEPYEPEPYEPYDGGGRHASGGGVNGHAARPGGYGRHLADPARPAPGGPPANGFGYHRPEVNGYAGPQPDGWAGEHAPAHPWGEVNGYHLEAPAPPAVNGYRLDEPVVPVNGFPYTAAPPAPVAYPVNGHGVDAAEREAASWPVDGRGTELDRPAYPAIPAEPRIAVVPLDGGTSQAPGRPAAAPARTPADAPAGKPAKSPHPPRAVVRRRRARRKALEWPFLIVFALVSAFLIRQYVVQTFYIPSASMHETLIEGDRVLVNKVGYHLHDVHRGDVVVFGKPPGLEVSEDDLIKRVVALPGETVEGRGGKVYVDGAPLDEPYVEPLCHGTGEFAKVTVPAGKLWVMGDNRCNSSDSRVFGPIGQDLVVGRAFVLAWPFDRLSWL